MSDAVQLDGLPAVELMAKVRDRLGRIYLSQIYGSFDKRFDGVPDIPGSLAEFSCPRCHEPFPFHQDCTCGAHMIGVDLACGGVIRICARNGCRRHFLQFEDIDDAFTLFEGQDE